MINGKIHYKWPFSIAMLNYLERKRASRLVICRICMDMLLEWDIWYVLIIWSQVFLIVFFARCQVGDATMSSRCALNTSKLEHHDSATYKWCPFCAHTNTMIHEGESLWSRTSWIYVCSSWIGHADFRLEHLCFPVESLKELDVYRNHWGLSLQSATGSVNFHEP
jgi:hypothetical protein